MASIFDPPEGSDLPSREPGVSSRNKKQPDYLTPSEYAAGKRTLFAKVQRAFETLEMAMMNADFSTAVKAAQIILDRSGYGPKSTVDVNTTSIDLTSLSEEELVARAKRVVRLIEERKSLPTTITVQ